MRTAGILAGIAILTSAAVLPLPAAAQTAPVEVVLQQAASSSAIRDQPYAAYIGTVALSPDGQRVLAGDSTGTVRLWNAADGSLLRTFRHSAMVSVVAFAPDSRRIVTVSKAIRVWDGETGRLIHVVDGMLPEIAPLAISPDGLRIVSAGTEATAVEWGLLSGRNLRIYSPDTVVGPLSVAAYSPDGHYLLTGHQDSALRLWDASSGELVRSLAAAENPPATLAFSPDNTRIVSLGGDTIRIQDTATGTLIRTMRFSNSATAISMLVQKDRLLLCDGNILSVIDPVRGNVVRTVNVHADRVTATALARDGKLVLVATDSGALRLVNAETGKTVRDFNTAYAATILSVEFAADGRHIFVGQNGKTIAQWDLGSARLARAFDGPETWTRSLAVSPEGRRLLSGDGSAFRLWDTATGRVVRTFEPTGNQSMPAALSPDGAYVLANGPKDNDVTLWDTADGAPVRTLQGDLSSVLRGVFSPDGRRVATIGFEEPVRLWDVATGTLIRTLKGSEKSTTPVAFSRDGRRLVMSQPNETAGIWDVDSGNRVDLPPFPSGESYSFSPDGTRLLATSVEQMSLIDAASGQLLAGFPGQIPFEIPALFLADSQTFLAGSYERDFSQRDVATGGIVREFTGHSGPVIALAISPDGKRAISGGPDTALKLWDIASGALLATFVAADNGEWIVLTPEGFFSASAKGADYLRVVRGFDSLSVESFRRLLDRPDLVAAKLAGDLHGAVREAAAKLDLAGAFTAARRAR